jgi:hypothetical protein
MKRILVWMVVAASIVSITYAIGLKVGTDHHKGADCSDWIEMALRDAKVEADAYSSPADRYDIEFTAFLSSIGSGVFFEGRDWANPKKGPARPAPHRICALDYSRSHAWKENYSPPKGNP